MSASKSKDEAAVVDDADAGNTSTEQGDNTGESGATDEANHGDVIDEEVKDDEDINEEEESFPFDGLEDFEVVDEVEDHVDGDSETNDDPKEEDNNIEEIGDVDLTGENEAEEGNGNVTDNVGEDQKTADDSGEAEQNESHNSNEECLEVQHEPEGDTCEEVEEGQGEGEDGTEEIGEMEEGDEDIEAVVEEGEEEYEGEGEEGEGEGAEGEGEEYEEQEDEGGEEVEEMEGEEEIVEEGMEEEGDAEEETYEEEQEEDGEEVEQLEQVEEEDCEVTEELEGVEEVEVEPVTRNMENLKKSIIISKVKIKYLKDVLLQPILNSAICYNLRFLGPKGCTKAGNLEIRFPTQKEAQEKVDTINNMVFTNGKKYKASLVGPGEGPLDWLMNEWQKCISPAGIFESRCVFVNNIPEFACEEMLRALYPTAESIHLPQRTDGLTNGYAMLEFPTQDEAEDIVQYSERYQARIGSNNLKLTILGQTKISAYKDPAASEPAVKANELQNDSAKKQIAVEVNKAQVKTTATKSIDVKDDVKKGTISKDSKPPTDKGKPDQKISESKNSSDTGKETGTDKGSKDSDKGTKDSDKGTKDSDKGTKDSDKGTKDSGKGKMTEKDMKDSDKDKKTEKDKKDNDKYKKTEKDKKDSDKGKKTDKNDSSYDSSKKKDTSDLLKKKTSSSSESSKKTSKDTSSRGWSRTERDFKRSSSKTQRLDRHGSERSTRSHRSMSDSRKSQQSDSKSSRSSDKKKTIGISNKDRGSLKSSDSSKQKDSKSQTGGKKPISNIVKKDPEPKAKSQNVKAPTIKSTGDQKKSWSGTTIPVQLGRTGNSAKRPNENSGGGNNRLDKRSRMDGPPGRLQMPGPGQLGPYPMGMNTPTSGPMVRGNFPQETMMRPSPPTNMMGPNMGPRRMGPMPNASFSPQSMMMGLNMPVPQQGMNTNSAMSNSGGQGMDGSVRGPMYVGPGNMNPPSQQQQQQQQGYNMDNRTSPDWQMNRNQSNISVPNPWDKPGVIRGESQPDIHNLRGELLKQLQVLETGNVSDPSDLSNIAQKLKQVQQSRNQSSPMGGFPGQGPQQSGYNQGSGLGSRNQGNMSQPLGEPRGNLPPQHASQNNFQNPPNNFQQGGFQNQGNMQQQQQQQSPQGVFRNWPNQSSGPGSGPQGDSSSPYGYQSYSSMNNTQPTGGIDSYHTAKGTTMSVGMGGYDMGPPSSRMDMPASFLKKLKTVYVQNLPKPVNYTEVKKFIRKEMVARNMCSIQDMPVVFVDSKKGYSTILFETEDMANRALDLDGINFEGHILNIRKMIL